MSDNCSSWTQECCSELRAFKRCKNFLHVHENNLSRKLHIAFLSSVCKEHISKLAKKYTVKRRDSWTARELLSSLRYLDMLCYSILGPEVHITSLCILNVTAIFSCEKNILPYFFFRLHLWQRYRNILLFLKALRTATSDLRRTPKPVTTAGGLSLRKQNGIGRDSFLLLISCLWREGGRDNQICKSPHID